MSVLKEHISYLPLKANQTTPNQMRVAIRSLPPIRWVPHRPILRTQRINRHPRIIPIRRRFLIQIRNTLCLIGNGRQGQLLLAGSVVSPLLDHDGLSEILVGGAHDGEAVDVGGRGGRVPVAGGGAGVGGVGGRAVEVGGAGHFAWIEWAPFVLSSATRHYLQSYVHATLTKNKKLNI